MYWSSQHGNLELTQFLVASGANIHLGSSSTETSERLTPLLAAARGCVAKLSDTHAAVVRFLTSEGARLSHLDNWDDRQVWKHEKVLNSLVQGCQERVSRELLPLFQEVLLGKSSTGKKNNEAKRVLIPELVHIIQEYVLPSHWEDVKDSMGATDEEIYEDYSLPSGGIWLGSGMEEEESDEEYEEEEDEDEDEEEEEEQQEKEEEEEENEEGGKEEAAEEGS